MFFFLNAVYFTYYSMCSTPFLHDDYDLVWLVLTSLDTQQHKYVQQANDTETALQLEEHSVERIYLRQRCSHGSQ